MAGPPSLAGASSKKKKVKKVTKTLGPKSKSKYQGVRPMGKKFSAMCWSREKKIVKRLGMFDSEMEAAAAVQEAKGNPKKAQRLLNEHQEGDPAPSE